MGMQIGLSGKQVALPDKRHCCINPLIASGSLRFITSTEFSQAEVADVVYLFIERVLLVR